MKKLSALVLAGFVATLSIGCTDTTVPSKTTKDVKKETTTVETKKTETKPDAPKAP